MKKFPVLKKRRKGEQSISKEEIININTLVAYPMIKQAWCVVIIVRSGSIFIVLTSLQIKILKGNGIALTVQNVMIKIIIIHNIV